MFLTLELSFHGAMKTLSPVFGRGFHNASRGADLHARTWFRYRFCQLESLDTIDWPLKIPVENWSSLEKCLVEKVQGNKLN